MPFGLADGDSVILSSPEPVSQPADHAMDSGSAHRCQTALGEQSRDRASRRHRLENSNVVDFEGLGKSPKIDALRAAPVTANRKVEDCIEGLVKRPGRRVAATVVAEGIVVDVVDPETDGLGCPEHLVAMKGPASISDGLAPATLGAAGMVVACGGLC